MRSFISLSGLIAASLVIAAPAQANPGGVPNGGVGAGGMGAGGVGVGGMGNGGIGNRGMGVGVGAGAHGSMGVDLPQRGANGQIGLDTAASVRAAERTRPSSLESNTRLQTALTSSLTRSGVTLPAGGLTAACSGFSNVGECLSAIHVSNNLGLTGGFDALKAQVTGENKVSLGKAIKQLKPEADSDAALRRARAQARAEIEASVDARGD